MVFFFGGGDETVGATNDDVVTWLVASRLPFGGEDLLVLSVLVFGVVLAATKASAASCSNSVAANKRQSVAFIFLFRNNMGRLSRRLIGVLLCGDPAVGEKFVSAFSDILRFVPVVAFDISVEEETVEVLAVWRTASSVVFLPLLLEIVGTRIDLVDEEDNGTASMEEGISRDGGVIIAAFASAIFSDRETCLEVVIGGCRRGSTSIR